MDEKKPAKQGSAPRFEHKSRPVSGKAEGKKPYGKPFDQRGPRKTGERLASGRPQGERQPFAPHTDKPFGRPAGEKKPVSTVNSRMVALEIFQDVVRKDAYAALSLDDRLRKTNLPQLDKRFCASLVYRTLENLIRIDYVLSFFLKDQNALDSRVVDILRLSVCQLLFHDRIPENAVVDEAVKLVRNLGMEGLTGLTNAVLRGIVRGKDEIKWPKPEEGAKYLSIMFSVPMWLAERLLDAYGPTVAREICAYRTENHFTTIRPNMLRFTDEEFEKLLEKKVWEVEKGAVPHAYRVRMASELGRDRDFGAGNFSIQGESSMLAAQAMDVKKGMQVLDCCAAPGGKSAYMAEAMEGVGRVYAWDLHDHRVELIRASMKRLQLDNVRPAVRDASVVKDELVGSMDAVLLDAPCSGLGVMDNKPDIKFRATSAGVAELAATQEKLLDACCRYVKKGGVMVYSTCSILPEENGDQVKTFLEKHPEFELAPLPAFFDEKFRKQYTETGLQLLPHRDGVEGFFIARMRRVK
ncbi:MAG: 16S rRNA (cytosine(967)-C(5))-methyltransferase RsmB [Clostridiales bacterium]|nr:16S rRNA (cytosine(967)-C(5))-methyltransferase RsmB [Clostridiales bacterium]